MKVGLLMQNALIWERIVGLLLEFGKMFNNHRWERNGVTTTTDGIQFVVGNDHKWEGAR